MIQSLLSIPESDSPVAAQQRNCNDESSDIDRGALRNLSEEEIDAWTGPVHYLSIDRVNKELRQPRTD